ncbi:type I 3-dehydroquinate dehydratase [Haloarculaceae archaeon H-GB2-1]|nr:type I 3-dehydroquinate dehydratase [Haloarculaceae archaeon H-GB1-1]MEA5387691.1 type I 3-dehydroquinate dehydratase [Haloarculaceae archaeon H-GB11]MEA5409180.1 type I 3-dehydroquinate dehydratase [Haloarculaceae archaeon H-GB2-1]
MNFDSFVLTASTADLADEPDARDHADAVEYRMDLADDPLAALAEYDGDLSILVTNRADWEGGEAADTPARLDALCSAVENEAVEAVDVELQTLDDGDGQRVVEHAHDNGASVVVSTHDFEVTPDRETLEDWLSRASSVGDVGKVAVTAHSPDDVLDLLAATRSRTVAGETVATMAMGEAGRHSRAVAPLYGSRIGYAPVDPADATAPGQYDLATLSDLVAKLEGR